MHHADLCCVKIYKKKTEEAKAWTESEVLLVMHKFLCVRWRQRVENRILNMAVDVRSKLSDAD